MTRGCPICGAADCFERALEARGVVAIDAPRRQEDMDEETIPAPERIVVTAPNGNRVVKYMPGDPIPISEARELGLAVTTGRKAIHDAEDKAVKLPSTKGGRRTPKEQR